MNQQLTFAAIIKGVGKEIYDRIDLSDNTSQELSNWISDSGLEAAPQPERTVCDLAAFNRFLKTTLYREYRQEGADLSALSAKEDIGMRLGAAHAETGDEAFRENPLDVFIKPLDPEIFAPLLNAREKMKQSDTPTDKIGQVFETLVDQSVRRKRGQFRTPPFVGDFMAQWAVTDGDDHVLDPGIGAGILTSRMYDAKQAAPDDTHINEVWGVDVSDLSIVMASTGLKLENGVGSPNFHQHDYMDTLAEDASARIDQQNPLPVPQMDAIVSNPPYSRSEALDGDRERYKKIIDAEAGVSMWGQTPLFAYFIIHSEQFLTDGGRLAFITSSRFFDTIYGEDLRTFLRDKFSIRAFVFLELDHDIFNDVDVAPCITLLEKDTGISDRDTAFVHVEQWPANPETIIEDIEAGTTGDVTFGFINRVSQQELDPQDNWKNYIDDIEIEIDSSLSKFGQLATIKRGIATGKNDYFCLTQQEIDEWGLDQRYLSKLLRRTDGFEELEITDDHWMSWRDQGDEVWLLYCYEDSDALEHVTDEALVAYLEYGCESGADESYLATNRSPWYAVDKRDPPDILATYMSKDGFRFIRNRAGIRTLNNLHNITLPDFNDAEKDALLAYLNSSVADEITKRSGRTYARGLHKIEPNELKDVPVIDTRQLSANDVKKLANVYTDLCDAISDDNRDVDVTMATLNRVVRDVLDTYTK